MNKQQLIDQAVSEFEEYIKPKIFCAGNHCSDLWNLECDSIEHNDGRELISKRKAIQFFSQQIESAYDKGREDGRKLADIIK